MYWHLKSTSNDDAWLIIAWNWDHLKSNEILGYLVTDSLPKRFQLLRIFILKGWFESLCERYTSFTEISPSVGHMTSEAETWRPWEDWCERSYRSWDRRVISLYSSWTFIELNIESQAAHRITFTEYIKNITWKKAQKIP